MKYLLKFLFTFRLSCLSSHCVVRVLYILWTQVLYRVSDLHIISPSRWLVFSSLPGVFETCMFLTLTKPNFFFFTCHAFVVISKSLRATQGHKDFLLFYPRSFIDVALTCRFMIHSELHTGTGHSSAPVQLGAWPELWLMLGRIFVGSHQRFLLPGIWVF